MYETFIGLEYINVRVVHLSRRRRSCKRRPLCVSRKGLIVGGMVRPGRSMLHGRDVRSSRHCPGLSFPVYLDLQFFKNIDNSAECNIINNQISYIIQLGGYCGPNACRVRMRGGNCHAHPGIMICNPDSGSFLHNLKRGKRYGAG